ncbi:MAG: IPT/TIG domain-containing protein [Bacteroidales bacterium]|nr:IPT/TIG domain-containing protein [Bacteroidales bacterium]
MLSFKVRNNRIKDLSLVLVFVFSALFLIRCEEDKAKERSYPRVRTNPVSGITSEGATFSAEIFSMGSESIINHGFVWSKFTYPDLTDNKILLGPSATPGTYSAVINASLSKDVEYTVKAFVQTSEHVVYGLPVTFKSLGSGGPSVTGFEPDSARWMDTLTVKGINFSWIASENVVRLNQTQCVTLNATDSTLKIIVNKDLADLKSLVSVEISGNPAVDLLDTFRLIPPVLHDYFPKQVRWGDTLTILGEDMQIGTSVNTISATIAGFSSKFTRKVKDTLKIIVPLEIVTVESVINIKINNLNIPFSQDLTLLPPVISSISPKEGTWLTLLTIKGKFHPTRERNIIKIGGVIASIVSNNKDSIRVYIPESLSKHDNPVVNSSSPFEVVSPDPFTLLPPLINSVAPLSGTSGSLVVLRGKYFGRYPETKVRFGTHEAYIFEFTDTYISCEVPENLPNGPIKITVTAGAQSTVYKDDYIVTNPIVRNVYPLSGTFNDQITIDGDNLSPAHVYFYEELYGETEATIISNTATRIIVMVPVGIDSIPRKIDVHVASAHTVYPEPFVLSPPEITSVSAPLFAPGQDITIHGRNFSPVFSNNQAYWGTSPLTVLSATPTEIVARIPLSMPRGINNVKVKSGGYLRSGPGLFEIQSAWNKIIPPQSLSWRSDPAFNSTGISFSLNGVGYLMDYYTGKILSFNPAGNIFSIVAEYPEWGGLGGVPSVVNRDTAWIVIGNQGVYRFDTNTFRWIYVCREPTTNRHGVALSIDGYLYYGLTIDYSQTNKFWKFNTSSETWSEVSSFPGYSQQAPVGSFTLNNKGYVLFNDNVFCSYDPANDTWTQLSSYPGLAEYSWGRASFAIGNLGYSGLGLSQSSSQAYDDIWVYDPATNTWAPETTIPEGGKYNSYSFVINNKAYIGFGLNLNIPRFDVFEYDPSYPSK